MHRPLAALAALVAAGCARSAGTALEAPARASAAPALGEEGYVPKDLAECFSVLKKRLRPEDIAKFKAGSVAGTGRYHFGLGMWMRNEWGLWGGSRLAKYFRKNSERTGVRHPDDISGLILIAFWHHLHGEDLTFEEYAGKYEMAMFPDLFDADGNPHAVPPEVREKGEPTRPRRQP